jgi:hypothetical protein
LLFIRKLILKVIRQRAEGASPLACLMLEQAVVAILADHVSLLVGSGGSE